MVKTLDAAVTKWGRKAKSASAKEKACRHFGMFLGKSVPNWCSAQAAGIDAATPEDYRAGLMAITDKTVVPEVTRVILELSPLVD